MSPRPDVSKQRKRQILAAATTVFSRLGFHNARMDDIVKESGLSKGALYRYFSSKDAIIIAILDDLFGRELEGLKELQAAPGSAGERLRIFLQHSLYDLQGMMSLMPITYEFFALASRQDSVRDILKNYLCRYMEILTPVIQQGIDDGEFLSMDPQDAVVAIGAVFEGTILLWAYDPETVDLTRHMRTSLELLLEGMRKK